MNAFILYLSTEVSQVFQLIINDLQNNTVFINPPYLIDIQEFGTIFCIFQNVCLTLEVLNLLKKPTKQ